MTKRTLLSIFGVALLMSMGVVTSGAKHPGAPQTSSSSAKKKSKTVPSKSKGKSKSKSVKGQTAPSADRIKEIQTALQKDGSYQGEPNGKWDEATAEAMKKYQDKNGFSPTGKIDAGSLNKMGLGSETAGKGAPVPAASSLAAPPDPSAKE
ncbi:MAG TPA: peptidoglycan-binding domain-containing protein [Candidatus Acidoferrales bacterium]|jgi:peptidoglycan hydrolase-like protein with peptidoglycan-binding domain